MDLANQANGNWAQIYNIKLLVAEVKMCLDHDG